MFRDIYPPTVFTTSKRPTNASERRKGRREGRPYQSCNTSTAKGRTVAQQVDQYFLHGIEFDEDISRAPLGLKGDEVDTVQEMRPDFLGTTQGQEGIKDHRASSPSYNLLH